MGDIQNADTRTDKQRARFVFTRFYCLTHARALACVGYLLYTIHHVSAVLRPRQIGRA